MAIKIYKRTSPGRRNSSVIDYRAIDDRSAREKPVHAASKKGGRNHQRHDHGPVPRRRHTKIYRLIDFKRNKDGVAGNVSTIEYDPNRTCFISLVHTPTARNATSCARRAEGRAMWSRAGRLRAEGRQRHAAGDRFRSGLEVHNIEMTPGRAASWFARAGNVARLVAKEGDWATLILPSGEMRMVRKECRATIGQSATSTAERSLGKAGRMRHMGTRPHVRGKAKNPVAHPMGGGEGRSNGGRHPCSPTGVLAKGGKTRNPRKTRNNRSFVASQECRANGSI